MEEPGIRRSGKPAAVLVDQERSVFPGIPVAKHHLHEFVCAVVTEIVVEMRVLSHVVGFAVVDGGNDVPGRAAAGHQIEGGETAGDGELLVICGRTGRVESTSFGL